MRRAMRWRGMALVSGSVLSLMLDAVPDTRTVFAQDLAISAKVDKTTVSIGDPIHLTITLSGELSGVELPPPVLPEGFVVAARSQSTNVSFRAGAAERSMGLVYVLIPQQAGTFSLGPFRVMQHGKEFTTDQIEITVNKPAVPPTLAPHGERFTL